MESRTTIREWYQAGCPGRFLPDGQGEVALSEVRYEDGWYRIVADGRVSLTSYRGWFLGTLILDPRPLEAETIRVELARMPWGRFAGQPDLDFACEALSKLPLLRLVVNQAGPGSLGLGFSRPLGGADRARLDSLTPEGLYANGELLILYWD